MKKLVDECFYHIAKRIKFKYVIINKYSIKCLGGEKGKMTKLIFVDDDEVPQSARGKKAPNYAEIFNQIPEGKTLKITKDGEFNISYTVARNAVKAINEKAGKEVFSAYQRAGTVYVSRV